MRRALCGLVIAAIGGLAFSLAGSQAAVGNAKYIPAEYLVMKSCLAISGALLLSVVFPDWARKTAACIKARRS